MGTSGHGNGLVRTLGLLGVCFEILIRGFTIMLPCRRSVFRARFWLDSVRRCFNICLLADLLPAGGHILKHRRTVSNQNPAHETDFRSGSTIEQPRVGDVRCWRTLHDSISFFRNHYKPSGAQAAGLFSRSPIFCGHLGNARAVRCE